MSIRIGLVGYGVGGQLFHAPYIRASKACELVGIVARSQERVSAAEGDNRGVPVHASLSALIDEGVDAVVISTPPPRARSWSWRRSVVERMSSPTSPSRRRRARGGSSRMQRTPRGSS